MNNDQFRRLILANEGTGKSAPKNGSTSSKTTVPIALGSRLRSSIPMTPRTGASNLGHVNFARQLAERNGLDSKTKKPGFRSFAPKGSKLAYGYVDRAKTREDDEREERLKRLDEAFKKGEVDCETYERLRGKIAGGDLASTHLVKGLDFKLLERVRRGEDVYGREKAAEGRLGEEEVSDVQPVGDVDDELERLATAEVKTVAKDKREKKGQFAATSALNPGQKRSRNQILAELKAAREAAMAKEQSALGSRFKKIGTKQKAGTRIERDRKGREVMIIVDEDGHETRKVRKLDSSAEDERQREREAMVPDKNAAVLGMAVPEQYRKQKQEEENEDDDKEPAIFDDVDSDYDPLAGLKDGSEDESSSSEHEEDGKVKSQSPKVANQAEAQDRNKEAISPSPKPSTAPSGPHNYFKDSKTGLLSEQTFKSQILDDSTVFAALKKAKTLSAVDQSKEQKKEAERQARLREMLQSTSRDDEDMDLGFGSSRVEDEADLEEESANVKWSTWKGLERVDDEEGEKGGGKGKRKRGGKKRMGDKNSVDHVMRVVEKNKGSGT